MEPETLLKFPCQFPIKVVGHGNCDLETIIFNLVRTHIPDLEKSAIRVQSSSTGKYISLTVTITAQSKPQLDAIYQDLTANDKVVMVL